jgi:hypothetical protein
MDNLTTGELPKKSLTIGEEFIDWAEKYWHLDRIHDNGSSHSESVSWDHVRKIFIKKIDGLISERLEHQL